MAHFGLEPAVAFNIATVVVQLGGSLLIILNRYTWLGAGALGIFTALTIPIVHHFWSMTEEPFRTIAFHTSAEHIGMIGALIVVSILAAYRNGSKVGLGPIGGRWGDEQPSPTPQSFVKTRASSSR